ncbi:Transient receptor potential cation channel subfamily A member 1 [Frankliniella fusca]|uniref:Transient receptor potential cation channel subfamily A member 1 n=1 Tax=Frankliniella fusca TaxID=407009 RepID=A0AAE1HQI1_9NEOP|nr:Transient receptor potential cation channel subfamily A member 1 [Frankliniella fusca]
MSYEQLYEAFKKCYASSLKPRMIQANCNECWKELKRTGDDGQKVDVQARVLAKIEELNIKATKTNSAFLSYFIKAHSSNRRSGGSGDSGPQSSAPGEVSGEVPQKSVTVNAGSGDQIEEDTGALDDEGPTSGRKRTRSRIVISSDESDADDPGVATGPRQEQLKREVSVTESELNTALLARDAGLLEGGDKTVTAIKKKLSKVKFALKRRWKKTVLERKYRRQRREQLQRLIRDNPSLKRTLRVHGAPGRPRLEEEQPGILKAITDIAIAGSGADARRRSESIRSVQTLDALHEELEALGYTLSRSATYLRLLPRRRHVSTVPVKLSRPQADLHRGHQDGKFCTATARYEISVEAVASVLGPRQVCFLSQDDKARVPLGITAATKQAPILMHTEYRVMLPDHDFVVGERHKLVPSVIAGIVINDKKVDGSPASVTYSGPTYIGIRSAKHNPSNAESHADDLRRILELDEFNDITKVDGEVKPVFVLSVDGGPDENPRYSKVIANAIENFRRYRLDAIFIFTNAPGRSAFNRVERRMAPLSKALTGVILEHDHFGSHLNSSNKTIDLALEKKNFEHAGKVLAEIWGAMSIDGHPVVAEFISEQSTDTPPMPCPEWYERHVRESQYFLQIVKCNDWLCCDEPRSDIKNVLPDGFIPAPFPLRRTEKGLLVPEPTSHEETDEIPPLWLRQALNLRPEADGFPSDLPYDLYCPSVKSQLEGRSCKECGLYFSSKKNAEAHKRQSHRMSQATKVRPKKLLKRRGDEILCSVEEEEVVEVTWIEREDLDMEGLEEPNDFEDDGGFPVIHDIHEWIQNPWTQDLPA